MQCSPLVYYSIFLSEWDANDLQISSGKTEYVDKPTFKKSNLHCNIVIVIPEHNF
jgi:hypothetical protein